LENLDEGSRFVILHGGFASDSVLTEDGDEAFGYKAISAGVGCGHLFDDKTIDGYAATGCFCPETIHCVPHVSFVGRGRGRQHIAPAVSLFVCPDDRFPPSDIF
jgi:hypothetical protein